MITNYLAAIKPRHLILPVTDAVMDEEWVNFVIPKSIKSIGIKSITNRVAKRTVKVPASSIVTDLAQTEGEFVMVPVQITMSSH